MIRRAVKEKLHPRNRFRAGYDFPRLIACSPGLAAFVAPNAYKDASVDYANPEAVKALNQALLASAYSLKSWDVPPGYLCPPIPGRSDYLHHLADLLGTVAGGWVMARSALVAQAKISGGETDPFYAAKIATARYFADHSLVAAPGLAQEVIEGGASGLTLAAELF